MEKIGDIQLTLSPKQASSEAVVKQQVAKSLAVDVNRICDIRLVKKSIDARKQRPVVLLQVQYFLDEPAPEFRYELPAYKDVRGADEVIVVGAGPAGLFAALRLLERGLKPVILERGRDVSSRKVDIAKMNRNEAFVPESNYCFGEGGAGTFSDGKLYTRSKKRGNVQRMFELFHYHGASDNILYEAHPHIGSDKLPQVIKSMRNAILEHGGEVHFDTQVAEFLIEDGAIKGCVTTNGHIFKSDKVILAIGHSAHDTYEQLHKQGVALEAKGFAMGVRVEHKQQLIDAIQYHSAVRDEYLPAASYALVTQVKGRGVYSFCMCPGGHIVPAGTGDERIVVNGMSASKRNSPYANSGIVVEVRPEDVPREYSKYGDLSGLKFQQHVEQLCFEHNEGLGLKAPAQRLYDFVKGQKSRDLPACSYLPGIVSSPLHEWLPKIIGERLQEGFRQFGQKKRGYLTNDAVIVGVETRSSSPVRIPRNKETLEHIEIRGLYPCGEGSGYAGGITSSAMDGWKVADII